MTLLKLNCIIILTKYKLILQQNGGITTYSISKLQQSNSEMSAKWRVTAYTVLFSVAAFLIFLPYWQNGRSLICSGDAAVQHYPALAYYGEYLRNILRTLWNEHSLEIPMWDFGFGYGGDIITTLHYYCLGDPISLLSVFFEEEQAELCYTMLIILRLYLSGLGMLLYCSHHNIKGYSAVIGALIYCFSGYAISAGVFHPFFSIPMIYLPLLFITSVALALLSNFYFFYMLVIFAVLYAVLRYFKYFQNFRILHCLRWIGVFFLCGIIGVLLAMPVFLPNLLSLLQSQRIQNLVEAPLLYSLDYYLALPAATVSEYGKYYVYITVSAVSMICVCLLFTFPLKENRSSIVACLVLFSFLLFPKIGSAFNGFNYVTNRWIWALSFLLAYITAKILPRAEALQKKQLIKLGVLVALFCTVCLLPSQARSVQTLVAIAVLAVCFLLMFLSYLRLINKKAFRTFVTIIVMFTVVANGYFHASPKYNNWVGNSQEIGAAYDRYYNSEMKQIATLPNADITRVDTDRDCLDFNSAIMYQSGGTGFYFSTINPYTALFQRSQMLNSAMDQQYKGLDGRSYLAAALSVSYYISDNNDTSPRPFGYNIPITDNIYTSEHTLPLVYVFDSVCTESEKMTVMQKQQALLQCAMTEEDYGLPCITPKYTDKEILFSIASADGVEMTDSGFKVNKDGAVLKLSFDAVSDCELYCIFEGLDFTPVANISETVLRLSDTTVSQQLHYKTSTDNYSSDKHDFLVNFGYSEKERKEITIFFPSAGEFVFSDFSLVAQPLSDLDTQIDALADSGISMISVKGDSIRFTSDRDLDGMACISVPYQEDGWRVTVDGEDATIVCIQDGLCGLYLEAGQHEIVMEYTTPYFTLSWCLFGFGLVLLAVIKICKFSVRACK